MKNHFWLFGLTGILLLTLLISVAKIRVRPYNDREVLSQNLDSIRGDCQIFYASPFVDQSLEISFEFSSDTLVCDRRSVNTLASERQIYIWQRKAFASSSAAEFFRGIVGQVSVNVEPGTLGVFRVQPGTVVRESSVLIANSTTTVKETRYPNCNDPLCPTARIAELKHGGNAFIIGENNKDIGLLRSFKFISKI